MKKINFKILFSLFMFWCLLTANFRIDNLLIGFFMSILVSVIFYNTSDYRKIKSIKLLSFLKFAFMVFFNIYKASFFYMKKIFYKEGEAEVININIGIKNHEAVLLIANAITLTPGTITLKILNDYTLKVLIQTSRIQDIEDFKKEIIVYKNILE